MMKTIFDFDIAEKTDDKGLFKLSFDYIIGTDEAGRGPGAGSVYAAAVCFKNYQNLEEFLPKLNDSKKLTEKTREVLFPLIKAHSAYSIQFSNVRQIEEMNILNASLDAMRRAVLEVATQLDSKNVLILVDGNKKIKNLDLPQKTIVKGDSTSGAIAAASILAKVSRDKKMLEYDLKFPEYNFKKNKGYLTKEHIEAIKTCGVTEIHRKSFLTKILQEISQ